MPPSQARGTPPWQRSARLAGLAALLVLAVIACSAGVQRPQICAQDADCAPDALCRQGACTADAPPRASVSGPSSALAHAETAFDGSASDDADDDIVAYTWSVRMTSGSCAPELGVSDGLTFRPVFLCPGEFEIILVVRDRAGLLSEPAVVPVTVAEQPRSPPTVSAGPELALEHRCEGVPLGCATLAADGARSFQLQASGRDEQGGDGVSYHWEWMAPPELAGAPAPAVTFAGGSDVPSPVVSITTPGTAIAGRWTFVVTVTDGNGLSARAEQAVVVQNRPPVLAGGGAISLPHGYDAAAARYRAAGKLVFTASDPDGDPVTPAWRFETAAPDHCAFGPGAAGEGSFELACSDPGELIGSVARTVTLQLSDPHGATSPAATWSLTVTNRSPALAGIEAQQLILPHQFAAGAYLASGPLSAFQDPDGDPLTVVDVASTSPCTSFSLARAGGTSTVSVACRVPYLVSTGGTPPLAQLLAPQRAAFAVKDPWGLTVASTTALQITDRPPVIALEQGQPLLFGETNTCLVDPWLGYAAPAASGPIAPTVSDPDGDPLLLAWGPPTAGGAPCGSVSVPGATCASGAASCSATVLTTCGGRAYDPPVLVPLTVSDGALPVTASFTARTTCTPP